MIFPDDLDGDVLRSMFEGGDSLTQPRELDFAHAFAERIAAEAFRDWAIEQGFSTALDEIGDRADEPFDVIVTRSMIPEHGTIRALEPVSYTHLTLPTKA